jgi:hypothetical protein
MIELKNTLIDTKHFAILNCAFHKMKPQDKYIDDFIPWQELWRVASHRWELVQAMQKNTVGEKDFFLVKWLGTYHEMRFRINGEWVLEGTFKKFYIKSIDIITWDDSEKVLAIFRE